MPPIAQAPDLYSGRNYPTDWKKFADIQLTASELRALGVTEKRADIFRWASRFRIAKSFEAVQLSKGARMKDDTKALLDCLFKIFLTYTAFEQFCTKVLKVAMNEDVELRQLQEPHGQAVVIGKIRKLDSKYQFFAFLSENLDTKPAKRMKDFISGSACNVSFLAKAVRHVFAHGSLSPRSGSSDLAQKKAITDEIHQFLIERIDDEFQSRVISKLPKRG